jgi:hypothetical protein
MAWPKRVYEGEANYVDGGVIHEVQQPPRHGALTVCGRDAEGIGMYRAPSEQLVTCLWCLAKS